MKIGILTQPLHNNYGGTLQAYALQKVLKEIGFNDVETIDYRAKESSDLKKILSYLKRSALGETQVKPFFKKEDLFRNSLHRLFIKENIKISKEINNSYDLRDYFQNKECVIVGSDQVWRKAYSNNIYDYFLEFIENNNDIKKITYAASFGHEKWDYDIDETKKLKELIKAIDSVSLREVKGVEMCSKYLNKQGILVLDPTLLLNRKYYENLADKSSFNKKGIFTYILDENEMKNKLIKEFEDDLCLSKFKCQPVFLKKKKMFEKVDLNFQYPAIEDWIKSFRNSDFVITDSFHGTVFSIIFNKQFVVISNSHRGNSRFESLLGVFNLSDRMIDLNCYDISKLKKNKIDYNVVNEKLDYLKGESISWLKENLVN